MFQRGWESTQYTVEVDRKQNQKFEITDIFRLYVTG